jgi:hypothetical protein
MATAVPFQPAELEEALRKVAQRAPLTVEERALVQQTLDETPPTEVDDWSDVTPEEMAQLERDAEAAEELVRTGGGTPWRQLFAERGLPIPPR